MCIAYLSKSFYHKSIPSRTVLKNYYLLEFFHAKFVSQENGQVGLHITQMYSCPHHIFAELWVSSSLYLQKTIS